MKKSELKNAIKEVLKENNKLYNADSFQKLLDKKLGSSISGLFDFIDYADKGQKITINDWVDLIMKHLKNFLIKGIQVDLDSK